MTSKPFGSKARRAYARLERSLPVRFKISTEKMNKTYTATTKNISQGGICLEIHQDTQELIENLSTADSKIGIDLDTMLPRAPAADSTTPASSEAASFAPTSGNSTKTTSPKAS